MSETSPEAASLASKIIDKWFPSEITEAGPTERILASVGRGVDKVVQEALSNESSKVFIASWTGAVLMRTANEIATKNFGVEEAIGHIASEALAFSVTAAVNRIRRGIKERGENT